MPITLEDGYEIPTPEETVVALLEQGYTPERIIAEAEENIAAAEAGIEWVDAVAGSVPVPHVSAKAAVQAALDALPANATERDVHKAIFDAGQDHVITSAAERDAKAAARQHARWANETIGNARRRIAAAKDSALVDPAVKRFKESKRAEAAALKAAR